jgi:uncharacterized membrane protein
MLGEHELTDHSQSLAALGIFPGSLLTLKVSFAEHCARNASLNSSTGKDDLKGGLEET